MFLFQCKTWCFKALFVHKHLTLQLFSKNIQLVEARQETGDRVHKMENKTNKVFGLLSQQPSDVIAAEQTAL